MVPTAIIICFVALGMGLVMYACMRRTAVLRPIDSRKLRFDENLLPGEPRDEHRRITYLFLNCANAEQTSEDYPAHDDIDFDDVLRKYRASNISAMLTSRGAEQLRQARLRYQKYLPRVVACFASSTARCLETARELLMIGKEFSKAERKHLRCNRITPLNCMSQYGVIREDGVPVASKYFNEIEGALSKLGTNECDLQTLYECKADGDSSVRSCVMRYTRQCVFALTESLASENKQSLVVQKQTDGNVYAEQEDIILVVGQTPYINAVAVAVAGVLGHSVEKRRELEEVNLADLDGFIVTRSGRTTGAIAFDVDEAQTPYD